MKRSERKFVGISTSYIPPRMRITSLAARAVLCQSETEDYKEGTDYGEEGMW